VKSAFEKAGDKRAVPGAPAILRALRAAGGEAHRICIISGSPRQMRRVLEAKLSLDGVQWDEFVLKPNLQNLVRGRFRALRSQIPYKLPALLESHVALGESPPETLFGDDAESDALIYMLYGDVVAGRVDRRTLGSILETSGAYEDQRERTLALAAEVGRAEVVKRILIHLDRRSPTAFFDRFGPRLVPIYNYFQAAIVLYADRLLTASDVVGVAREMLASGDYQLSSLANSVQDLLRRGRLARDDAARLSIESQSAIDDHRAEWKELPAKEEIAWSFATRVRALGDHAILPPPREPARINYLELIGEERRKRRAR
jgi:hypothetical protein